MGLLYVIELSGVRGWFAEGADLLRQVKLRLGVRGLLLLALYFPFVAVWHMSARIRAWFDQSLMNRLIFTAVLAAICLFGTYLWVQRQYPPPSTPTTVAAPPESQRDQRAEQLAAENEKLQTELNRLRNENQSLRLPPAQTTATTPRRTTNQTYKVPYEQLTYEQKLLESCPENGPCKPILKP